MVYFAVYDGQGKLISVGYTSAPNATGTEITRAQYLTLLADIEAKNEWADMVYCGRAAIVDVPEEWRTEVQEMVDERIAAEGVYDPDEISDAQALAIITGVNA